MDASSVSSIDKEFAHIYKRGGNLIIVVRRADKDKLMELKAELENKHSMNVMVSSCQEPCFD